MLSMFLCSCSDVVNEEREIEYSSMYNEIQVGLNSWIYVDTETNVMYWYYTDGYGGGLTPMLNADGTAKLYDETISQYGANQIIKSVSRFFVDTETNVMY